MSSRILFARGALGLGLAALTITACKKKDEPAPPATGSAAAGSAAGSAGSAAGSAGSAAGSASATDAIATAQAKLATDIAAEVARWTPELEAEAAKLTSREFTDTAAAMAAILPSSHRTPGNADRDRYRHPAETLAFFGVRPDSHVVEFGGGGGWYTELLAPLLARTGTLAVTGADPKGPADQMSTVYGQRLAAFLGKSPSAYGKVVHVVLDPAAPKLGPDGSADVVLAIREMHNWLRRGQLDANLQAALAVLKPGGTFGVVQHRAKADAAGEVTGEQGYLPEAWVIERVTAAGFQLAEKSELNANPADTADYPKGVWTLPPNLREGDTDRARYVAIGESDRMTLRFTKPAAP
ncbi:MAG: hypothetical protein R2939_02805 [Kofleriaceae bacterium]